MAAIEKQPNAYKGMRRVLYGFSTWQEYAPILHHLNVLPLAQAGKVRTRCEDKRGYYSIFCLAEAREAVLAAYKEVSK